MHRIRARDLLAGSQPTGRPLTEDQEERLEELLGALALAAAAGGVGAAVLQKSGIAGKIWKSLKSLFGFVPAVGGGSGGEPLADSKRSALSGNVRWEHSSLTAEARKALTRMVRDHSIEGLRNPSEFHRLVLAAPLKDLDDATWKVVDPRSFNATKGRSLWDAARGKRRQIEREVSRVRAGSSLSAPIVVKASASRAPVLISGDDDLLIARALGVRPKIAFFDGSAYQAEDAGETCPDCEGGIAHSHGGVKVGGH